MYDFIKGTIVFSKDDSLKIVEEFFARLEPILEEKDCQLKLANICLM